MNQKGFAKIVPIVIIVMLVGVAGYFALIRKSTPTPTNETANWETYRNDKYGFEFKYPSQIIYPDSGSRTRPPQENVVGYPGLLEWQGGVATDVSFYLIPSNKSDPNFIFFGLLFPIGLNFSIYEKGFSPYKIDPQQQKILEQSGKQIKIEKITVNDILGTKTTVNDGDSERIYIELEKDGLIYGIVYARSIKENEVLTLKNAKFENEVIQQVLSTLRFIK